MEATKKLLILIPFVVFADAAFELATAPGICSRTVQIRDGEYVTQTLCFVTQDRTHYQARQICEARGMRLAEGSSPRVVAALVAFGTTVLRSPKAEVFISGRTGGRCSALTGSGKLKTMGCAIPSHFLCEFFQPITTVECSTYDNELTTDPLVDPTGITDPQTCKFTGTVANIYTQLSSTTAVAKERVVVVYLSGNTNVANLPVNLAENFPNVNLLYAAGCGISQILPQQFQGLTKLTLLNLNSNQLTIIDSNVFNSLSNLKLLDIGNNPLTTMSGDIFEVALPMLESLSAADAGCLDLNIDIYQDRDTLTFYPGLSTACTII